MREWEPEIVLWRSQVNIFINLENLNCFGKDKPNSFFFLKKKLITYCESLINYIIIKIKKNESWIKCIYIIV